MPKTGFVAEYNSCSCASRPWAVRAQVRLCGQPQPELDTKTGTGKILDALTSHTEDFLQVSSCFFEDISNRYQYNLVSTAASNSFVWQNEGWQDLARKG